MLCTLVLEVLYRILYNHSLQCLEDLVLVVALKELGLFFGMRSASKFKIESLGLGAEESLFEVSNELILGDGLQDIKLFLLSLELVLMRSNFVPVSAIFSVKVDVFLSNLSVNCLFLYINNFISDVQKQAI